MSDDRMARLEQRLAIAERDAEIMREQLREIGDRQQPRSHARRNGIFGLLAASLLLFAVTQPFSGQAQGAAAPGLTVKAPFQVVDAGGKVLLRVSAIDGTAQLLLGDAKTGGVDIGVGRSGAGFMIVRRGGGKDGIVLGQLEGRPMSVGVFGDGGKELVTLATGQKGGSVKVMNATGAAVAALLAGESGGGVALTGPSGGKSAVSLSVSSTGGNVRVFPQAGGSTQAELTAGPSGGGTVNVYNKGGEPVVWMEATSQDQGRLQVGRAGKVYVEAAVLPSGVGMVVAGPQIGGAPPGLVIPNFIKGRTGGK